jgi:hypothetical protein
MREKDEAKRPQSEGVTPKLVVQSAFDTDSIQHDAVSCEADRTAFGGIGEVTV